MTINKKNKKKSYWDKTHYSIFPKNKTKWKIYFKAFLPVMFSSLLYALNGFVDNFMVGKVNGAAALSAANSWTAIVLGFLIAISSAGSIIMAQYYFSENYEMAKQVSKIRFLLSVSVVLLFSIIVSIIPEKFIDVYMKKPLNANRDFFHQYWQGIQYLKYVTISWVLISFTANFGFQLREINLSKYPLYWGILSLTINISLNAIFIYGIGTDVDGAAFATIAARFSVLLFVSIVYIIKKPKIAFNPLKIFIIDKLIWKQMLKRWFVFISTFAVFFAVIFRNKFYDMAYPDSSIDKNIGALDVIGISGAIQNLFTTMFSVTGTMAVLFVGSELGKNNIQKAKENAGELRGFNTLNAFILSILLCIMATFVPYMTFLVHDDNLAAIHPQLINIRNSLYVIAVIYPFWIWFTTIRRNSLSGGKGFWFQLGDIIITILQIGWIAILAFFIVEVQSPANKNLFWTDHFWLMYAIFLSSDLFKLLWMEIAVRKVDWARSIVNNNNKKIFKN
ncbi:MAG: hypothetical protein K4H23_04810 [Mollicutes bacterium PWAP]|nr:hypothetical protein [Mollicutes bacterium PWAP]